jgi:hypothetical protein
MEQQRPVKPPRTKEQVEERLAQHAVRFTPRPRKGTRAARKRKAQEDSSDQ